MTRRRLAALGTVLVLTVTACGDDGIEASGSEPERSDPSVVVLPDGHRVDVGGVEVAGPLVGVLDVRVVTEQTVIFPVGGPARLVLSFSATEHVSLSRLPFHSDVVRSIDGAGILGHRGVCGQGWDESGRQMSDDPCPAAEPATEVWADAIVEIPIFLHRITDTGAVAPGSYRMVVPLDDHSTLELDVDLSTVTCRQGPATTLAGAPGAGGGEYTCSLE